MYKLGPKESLYIFNNSSKSLINGSISLVMQTKQWGIFTITNVTPRTISSTSNTTLLSPSDLYGYMNSHS